MGDHELTRNSRSLLHNDRITADADTSFADDFNRQLMTYGTTPVAVVGILLNVLLLWILSTQQHDFEASRFLMKVLAVLDSMYIGNVCVRTYCTEGSLLRFLVGGVESGCQYILVNVLTLLSACHLFALRSPESVHVHLNPYHVYHALSLVIGFCLTMTSVNMIVSHFAGGRAAKAAAVTGMQLMISVPLVLQALLLGYLVRTLRRQNKKGGRMRGSAQRRITLTVLALLVASLVTYPVPVALATFFKVTTKFPKVHGMLSGAIDLLWVANSSFRIVWYVTFIPSFRKISLVRPAHTSVTRTSDGTSEQEKGGGGRKEWGATEEGGKGEERYNTVQCHTLYFKDT